MSFLLLQLVAASGSEHDFYVSYSTLDGLPDTYIVCCDQDAFNRMWVGTRDGVYYYAGSSFVPFDNPDYLESCSRMTTAIGVDVDDNIWMCSSDGMGFYDVNVDLFTPVHELDGQEVVDIDFDATGNAWITTSGGIWFCSRKDHKVEKKVSSDLFSPQFSCFTDKGELVFTAANSNIYTYDPKSSSLRVVKAEPEEGTSAFRQLAYIGGRYVLAASDPKHVARVNIDDGKVEMLIDSRQIENMAEIQSIIVSGRGNYYWIGTSYGLIIYDNLTKKIERQFPDRSEKNALGGESVRYLYEDKQGNIWAGTWNGGLRCWMAYQDSFGRYLADGLEGSICGETVRSISPDRYGYIWVGTEEGHLNRFSLQSETFEDFTSRTGIPYGISIIDIEQVGNDLWIATYGSGLYVFDPKTCRTVRHCNLPSKHCMTILQTSDSDVYVGTTEGLFLYDPSKDDFDLVDVVGKKFIHCLHEDKDHRLWVGSHGSGLGTLDLDDGYFRIANVNDGVGLESNYILSLYEDKDGAIWITTEGAGIGKVIRSDEDDSFNVRHFTKEDGFPSNSCVSISGAGNGRMWVATSNGLVEFDPVGEKVVKTYMQADRVIGSRFSYKANHVSGDGKIYLGTSEGLLVFDPDLFVEKFRDMPLYITNIVSDTGQEKKMVAQAGRSVITSEEIVLKEKEASYLEISFSSMYYSMPNAVRYDCSLRKFGFSSELTTDVGQMAYTGLAPGKYDFTVNYHDSHDPLTECRMTIVVKASWYKSTIGYIVYTLLLALVIFTLICIRRRRMKAESKRRMEIKEMERQKAIAHEKVDFLANIAHEIRTPVALISLLFDRMLEDKDLPQSLRTQISDNMLNIDRLRSLCNDVLDLKKMEHLQKNIVITSENITRIVGNTVRSFVPFAESRDLTVRTQIPDKDIFVSCSVDAVDTILSNLLSNAVKYSSSSFQVTLTENEDFVVIRVDSDGTRIPDRESERIFEAFYQSKQIESSGAGIGLTYSRSLAALQNARLYLDTKVRDVNSFVLELPKAGQVKEDDKESQIVEEMLSAHDKPCILVVEDNPQMRCSIKEALMPDFDVIDAENGEEALSKIESEIIDLVISDIMMPVMNGCELCNAIKSDIRYSHIPVILLTAAVGVDTHIQSLKSGADLYLEKPFKMEILKESVRNQFKNREIRNMQFAHYPLSHFNSSTFSKVEHDFMERLSAVLMDNLSDNDLGIRKLAEMMSVSGGTLSKKVKANTGLTVNEYIRISRLKKAAALLADNKYRINEVAYLTGFSTPSYFTQSFRKEFGILPSEFIKEHQKPER